MRHLRGDARERKTALLKLLAFLQFLQRFVPHFLNLRKPLFFCSKSFGRKRLRNRRKDGNVEFKLQLLLVQNLLLQ